MAKPSESAAPTPSFDHDRYTQHFTSQDSTLVTNSRANSSEQPDNQTLHGPNFPNGNPVKQPVLLDEDEPSPADTTTILTVPRSVSTADQPSDKLEKVSVGWSDLPKKGQLAVLTLARLSEPLAERSLAAYLFYQLRSFDLELPDSTISAQGGFLTAAFAGAQFLTAFWWGRMADSPRVGRKNVIIIGLTGSSIATLGVGFSKSFAQAITWRIIAGALNGNSGVMRTMISEMIEERKFQSRAFLLLPMCFNIGVVIGPILGGFLADPIKSFPKTFGPGSAIGGERGVAWMLEFPYALPNLFTASLMFMAVLGVILGLDETHQLRKHRRDWGRRLGNFIARTFFRRKPGFEYRPLETDETELDSDMRPRSILTEQEHQLRSSESGLGQKHFHQSSLHGESEVASSQRARIGLRSILTSNVVLTLTSHFLLALHVSTFNALIFLFLPNPPSQIKPSSFSLRFSGGVGLSSEKVGLATAILGVIGFPLQILAYPSINTRLGTLRSYRWFLPFSVVAYVAIPFLALVYDKPLVLWPFLTLVLAAQVISRTFALPSTTILINNSSPSPASLATLHGVAQSVSSGARMLGPIIGGWGLGLGLRSNCVGAVWWTLAVVVGANWSLLWVIWEGDGRGGTLKS